VKYSIVTLDPNRFAEKKQQCFHIGDIQLFKPRISLLKQSSPVTTELLFYDKTSAGNRGKPTPYPPDTKAFLYYSMSPEKPRIAGELRLRVASSNDAAFFESGSDLLRPDGRLWSRPLYNLSKYYPLLYEKLREDHLVPDDLDRVLAALPSKRHKNRFLYTLNDTFIVDFSSSGMCFFVITEQGVHLLPFYEVFLDKRVGCMAKPYIGAYTSHRLSILLY
jgi:hypothetical protein